MCVNDTEVVSACDGQWQMTSELNLDRNLHIILKKEKTDILGIETLGKNLQISGWEVSQNYLRWLWYGLQRT